MDRLSDMITRIKNGQSRGKLTVDVLASKFCESVLDCLSREGFIRGYKISEDGRTFCVYLKYHNNEPVIKECKRISRQGRRVYFNVKKLKEAYFNNKLIVYSSSKGVYLNSRLSELDKEDQVGGEALLSIK